MNNLLTIIIQIFFFTTLYLFILWNRLFREFSIKNLYEFKFPLGINILFIVIFFITIIISILTVMNFSLLKGNNKPLFITKIIRIIQAYFGNAPETILRLISNKIDLVALITKPTSYVVAYMNYPKLLIILFTSLPMITISIIFFWEVLYYHHIQYFYIMLPLLLIPLLFSSLVYSLDTIVLAQLDYVSAHLTCEKVNNQWKLQLAPRPPDILNALTLEEMQRKFIWLCYQYEIFSQIKAFFDKLNCIKSKYSPWVSLFCAILYFISWCSILLF